MRPNFNLGAFSATAAILRCYDNPGVLTAVLRLLENGLGKVVVVIDGSKDNGTTPRLLAGLTDDPRVRLVTMETGYTWTNALNRGVQAVKQENAFNHKRKKKDVNFYGFLAISVEANPTFQQLYAMHQSTERWDHWRGVVGTTFAAHKPDGTPATLGSSYRHPRNTGMLVSLMAYDAVGGFDPACDQLGGMEDIDFILGLRALTSFYTVQIPLNMDLTVGVNYHQEEKEAREQTAVTKIVAKWRALFPEGTEERTAIETVVKEMQLEG